MSVINRYTLFPLGQGGHIKNIPGKKDLLVGMFYNQSEINYKKSA